MIRSTNAKGPSISPRAGPTGTGVGQAYYTSGGIPFSTLLTTIGAACATIYVDSVVTLVAPVTVPINVQIIDLECGSYTGPFTLTFNGPYEGSLSAHFGSNVTVVFDKPPLLKSVWWGDTGDNSTNDAAAINKAIVCANASGGGDVEIGPDTHFTGTTPLAVLSNVNLVGRGESLTTIRPADVGAFGALTYVVTMGAAVTNASVKRMTLACTTMATNGVCGIDARGTHLKIHDIETSNLKIGILGSKTSQYVDVESYKQSSTTGMASFGILLNGVQDWALDNIDCLGASTSIGIDKPCSFQNGGTVYGCQRVTVTNYKSNYSVSYGLGGNVDDFYPDVTATYPNPAPTWTMLFKGPTGVIATDIGKTIVQGANTMGVLLAYDDTVIPSRWVIALGTVGNDPALIIANTATTITLGTGAGTTLINNHRMKAPTITNADWDGIECNHGLNTLIGHGWLLDSSYSVNISNFSCDYNSEAGGYIGDALSLGCNISNGSCRYNDWGIVAASSAITSLKGCYLEENKLAGLYFVPIASGLSNVVNYTLIANNNITRNGRRYSSTLDSGIGGEPSYCVFSGNNVSENYGNNIGLTGGVNCIWQTNQLFDSGWAPRYSLLLGGVYTNAIATDLWKTVVTSGGAKGLLSSYDNGTKIWTVTVASGTFTALDSITITGGTGASTSITTVTQIKKDSVYMEDGNGHVFENNFVGGRLTPSTVGYGFNLVTNSNDNIIRENIIIGWSLGAIIDGGTRNQDLDNWKDTTATSILNGTGLTARTTGPALNYPTATTNSTINPALTLDNPTTGAITRTLKVFANVNTNAGFEPYNIAAEILNRHADYSTDMVILANDGVAGNFNATNGAWLACKDGATYLMRVQKNTISLGAVTESTTPTSGAMTLAGGLGVAKDLFARSINAMLNSNAINLLASLFNPSTGTGAGAKMLIGQSSANYFGFQYHGSGFTPSGNLAALQGVIYLPAASTGGFMIRCDADAPLLFNTNNTEILKLQSTAITASKDVKLGTAGLGVYVKEGTNATMGIATLIAGVVVVATTKVTASSRIFLTRQTIAGTIGSSVDVTARNAGTSFTITANGSILDTSTVAWWIVEPA